ncbi:hypothetical protein D9758_001588 [Tetrapyrgos nigripes]|uniref:Uncharacterized protein n=1 Tax=Tetrapyrgos nigripes TaxID=182062 RepID=A0A8H5LXI4_9AGAR|nr:hypothetical protein D9758_001588 [Tetrapyrgos nigripes]
MAAGSVGVGFEASSLSITKRDGHVTSPTMTSFEHRPQMRRKSSAQNLLSSFNPKQIQPPPPIAVSSSNNSAYSVPPVAQTPTATTPREWDAQSLHNEPLGTPGPVQHTNDEYLRDLIQKRILTLTYIRNIHEGRSHWFHTIYISRAELDKEFNNTDMKKRTSRFALLGMSLANLLDIQQPHDLLRGLLNTLIEYDQAREDGDKTRIYGMVSSSAFSNTRPNPRVAVQKLFRTKAGKKPGVLTEYSGTYGDASAESYLVNPHIPFPLDYHQTLLSLLDVLSEVYNKISKLLGPSPLPHSQHMMGPLGLIVPHPGVSYLFQDGTTSAHPSNYQTFGGSVGSPNPNNPSPGANLASTSTSTLQSTQHQTFGSSFSNLSETELSSSLWGIANANGAAGVSGSFVFNGTGASGGTSQGWSSAYADMVLKIDSKFKKITSTLLKELDQFARSGIKEELASLDPLLRNIKMSDLDGLSGGVRNYDL